MEAELKTFVASLQLGEAQTYKHIVVLPLTGPPGGGPPYLTLNEALGGQQLTVTEVSQRAAQKQKSRGFCPGPSAHTNEN